jgi:hypothetical protein
VAVIASDPASARLSELSAPFSAFCGWILFSTEEASDSVREAAQNAEDAYNRFFAAVRDDLGVCPSRI